jgi:hypothetical protein
MKAKLKAIGIVAALVIGLTLMPSLTQADETNVPSSPAALLKALAEAGKPGPEHRKLEPFIGDWNLTMKLWTDPSQPPAEINAAAERKWIMGGRFVQESVRGECNGKSFEGLGLLGYHNGEKKFTTTRACGLCGTVSTALSTLNSSEKKFTCSTEECCPVTGQKVKGRDEVIIESNDRIVTNIFKVLDGREMKVMEIVSIRK